MRAFIAAMVDEERRISVLLLSMDSHAFMSNANKLFILMKREMKSESFSN